MDISELVKSDQLFALEIKHPVTDEPLGITVMVRSALSERVKAIDRKRQDELLRKIQRGKTIGANQSEANAIERAAAMIESWDWQSDLTLNGEETPECTQKNKAAFVDVDSFFDQIIEAATDVANFT